MELVGTFTTGDSAAIRLPYGGFVAVTGTFNGATVDLEFEDANGTFHSFANATAESAPFEYEVSNGVDITVRAGTQSGTPTGNLSLWVSRNRAPREN